jgi:hypothetical protein
MADIDHRAIGVKTYNRCWELLETEHRTNEQDTELLTNAFTSRFHWSFVGGPEQFALSYWMISRAFAALGEGHLAVRYGEMANDIAQGDGLPDWLVASTAEGLARAYAAQGDTSARRQWSEVARERIAAIADKDDRELIASQLASLS